MNWRVTPMRRASRSIARSRSTGKSTFTRCAAVSRCTAHAGLVVIPLSLAQAASALTLVYRENNGRPNAVEDFVDVLRSTGEDRVSRKTPIALRMSR
jgi:DNA-binding transcriptional LysR family regulator